MERQSAEPEAGPRDDAEAGPRDDAQDAQGPGAGPSRGSDVPVASIIVPSYRGASRLPALLDSLSAQADAPPFEVIVVVDGDDDGSVELVEARNGAAVPHEAMTRSGTPFAARAILLPENRGRVTALNKGFEAARGEVLIRCDDDLVVPPAFVAAHVSAHADPVHPVGVVGLTRDVHDEDPYARAYGRDAAARSLAHAASRPPGERWRHWAANCSITRATWREVGPYDTAYRAYGWEDVDYGWRLHAAGIELVHVDAVTAEHHGPARTAAARAAKALAAGIARTTFRRLHPAAPVAQPSAGRGPWGAVVAATAAVMRSERSAARIGRVVDRMLPHLPAPVGRKLVAAAVEGAGVAGGRGPASSSRALRRSRGNAPAARVQAEEARPRIAIAHDYLTQRGGAERLVLSICRAFPQAELHTLFYEPSQTYPEYRDRVIRTSPLDRIGVLRRDPRLALPLLAPVASRMRIDADVVIASSSGWAHAFATTGARVVYCHAPARWLYLPEDYLGQAGRLDPKRLALAVLAPALRRWDRRAARRADRYLANSTVVRERIGRVYGIDAPTLFPPFSPDVAEGVQEPIPDLAGWAGADGTAGGHALVVSRLQPYKHVDRVIEAFAAMPEHRLLVIGTGPERERLRALAPANVRLVEGLSDAQMRWAYAHSSMLVAASHEDFGLTPLEAGAHGVPTLALRAGGYLDTITEGTSGLFFDEAAPPAIAAGVRAIEQHGPWSREAIREHVEAFSEERFIMRLREVVSSTSAPSAPRPSGER